MTSRKITYSSDAVNSERSRAGQEKYITSRKPKEMEMRDTHRLIEFVTALYRLAPGPLRFNHEDGQNLYVVREALRELQSLREENERLQSNSNAWNRVYNKFRDHPDFRKIAFEHAESGNASAASILIEFVENALENPHD